MKYWQCSKCKREREFVESLIMKICPVCQIKMEVKEVIENGYR